MSVVVPGQGLQFACLCSLPPTFLKSATAAAGIDAVGNVGGFIAQNLVPWIKDATGGDLAPMLVLAVCLAAGAMMMFVIQAMLEAPADAERPAVRARVRRRRSGRPFPECPWGQAAPPGEPGDGRSPRRPSPCLPQVGSPSCDPALAPSRLRRTCPEIFPVSQDCP